MATFCIAPPGSPSEDDLRLIETQGLQVEFRSSDEIPRRLSKKIAWYAAAIKNRYGATEASTPDVSSGLSLEDFRWPWAIDAFRESVARFEPDIVLIEYVKLAYLLEALPDKKSITRIIDTHDVLHRRFQQFNERQQPHWIEISAEEEAAALQGFDIILAIEPGEAGWFKQVVPSANVLLCPHATLLDAMVKPSNPTMNSPVTLGYLGSDNASNRDALEAFLEGVWPDLVARYTDSIELLIGGQVSFDSQLAVGPIRVLGPVKDLSGFYEQVDIAINPALYGTGLKIKSVEALSFGKPLVCTREGAAGLPLTDSIAVSTCHQMSEFAEPINRLMDPTIRQQASQAAIQLARAELSAQTVYAPLMAALRG